MELKKSVASPLRALLTECLPYEVPLEINSNWLYDWIDQTAAHVSKEGIYFRPTSRFDLLVLALLFPRDKQLPPHASLDNSPRVFLPSPLRPLQQSWRAPASFVVRRDRLKVRDLSVITIASQLSVAFIYYLKKDVILHHVNADDSSLRHPLKTNAYSKYLRNKHRTNHKKATFSVETDSRKLGTYNSFFVYSEYAFVGQFYDSNRWQALEARWRYMRRLDVANCFASIYTHTFAWSTGTDIHSKMHLTTSGSADVELDLGRAFDKVMQSANWGETHGICVGPEASRIFAEVIFQAIDKQIKSRLGELEFDFSSFEILRYVDDYFIFALDEAIMAAVSQVVVEVLNEHRFAVNDSKTREYLTPFTTEVSSRKSRLKVFLRSALPFNGEFPDYDAREISVQLKGLLIDTSNDAVAVGTSLSNIERRLRKFIVKRTATVGNYEEAHELLEYIWIFVHSMLYQYLSHPSVASSMKIVRILRLVSYFSAYCGLLNDRSQKLLKYKSSEYTRFAVQKAVQRLLDENNTEVELCHFMSLASASDFDFSQDSRILRKILRTIDNASRKSHGAKANQSMLFQHLSFMKYFLSRDNLRPAVRAPIIEATSRIASTIYAENFIPDDVIASHASQEVFIAAIASCPYLCTEEKFEILDKHWVGQFIRRKFLPPEAGAKASSRFLWTILEDAEDATSEISPFLWTTEEFDTLLYEKEAQFVY